MASASNDLITTLMDTSDQIGDLLAAIGGPLPTLTPWQERVLTLLQSLETKVDKLMSGQNQLDTGIAQLIADNTALAAQIAAAPAAIATLVATAVAAAVAAGATPAELAEIAALHTSLGGDQAQLAAALAGTPPAPPTGS